MASKENIRNYEVSIWTLQDSFITVLKPLNLENKGVIQDGKITLQDDGENRISFSIPMYIRQNGDFIENPLWYNKTEGNLIANLRKLKVIFNKKTANEEVFEFLITKVTEKHEGFSKICDIEGEGLAFNELGKQGYRIELSADNLYAEADEAADNGTIINNNINYWCDKVFENSNWRYSIQMDWSIDDGIFDHQEAGATRYEDLTEEQRNTLNTSRAALGLRRRDKIYEDSYVSSWPVSGENLIPTSGAIVAATEKKRIVEGSESNRYNLIQTIAETFGVFTKFKYYYDDNYHIIDREVIFYNNFLNEEGEVIDLTYNYDIQSISRTLDATEIVTKMYVKSLDDSGSPNGMISIADTPANKSGEDYILNFDYLYDTKTISDEQYAEVKKHEAELALLNKEIISLENEILQLDDDLLEAEVKRDNASAIMAEALENVNDSNDVINNITGGDGILEVTADNPGFILITKNTDNNNYTGKFGVQYTGVLRDTVVVYKTFPFDPEEDDGINVTVNGEGKIATSVSIDARELEENFNGSHCYATFQYQPSLVAQQTVAEYQKLANKNETIYKEMTALIEGTGKSTDSDKKRLGLKAYLEQQTQAKDGKIAEKNAKIAKFENMMGPALREGTWQPEDEYAQYGEQHNETVDYSFSRTNSDSTSLLSFIWDNELFEDEEKNYEEVGVDQTQVYYPCIDLSQNYTLLTKLANNEFLDNLVFSYKATDETVTLQAASIKNNCKLGFVRSKTNTTEAIKPVLMLLNLEDYEITTSNYSTEMTKIKALKQQMISYLQVENIASGATADNENIFSINSNWWIANPTDYEIVYPRLQINSNYLKTGENELSLILGEVLEEYEDYYIFRRDEKNYITIKPETIFRNSTYSGQTITSKIKINYYLLSAAIQVYLDAIDVMKENAYPKVSYTINDLIANSNISYTAYNRLGQLAHINDAELKFNGTMGYISAVELDLDKPWEDSITIQNYKNKFEDLFSTIVAQTEEMKKNAYRIGIAAGNFTADGQLKSLLSDTALENSKLKLNAVIQKNANVIAANAISDAAKNKAILASTNAYRIMNGEIGLAFTSPIITNLEINQNKGLLIEGVVPGKESGTSDEVFFNVTNERMGFYKGTYANKENSTPLLFFKNGDLALSGNIYAENGWFGAENGWIIGLGTTDSNSTKIINKIKNGSTSAPSGSASKSISSSELGGLLYSANGKAIFTAGTDSKPPMIVLTKNGFSNTSATNDAVFLFDGSNLYINGTISAAAGSIGGWYIGSSHLGDNTAQLNSTVGMASGKDSSEQSQKYSFWAGGEYSGTPKFSVTSSGYLTSTSGKIANWVISLNQLNSDTTTNSAYIALNSDTSNSYAIWAGNSTAASAPFFVKKDGTIYSTSGKIGGWYIGSNYLGNASSLDSSSIGFHTNTGSNIILWAGSTTRTSAAFRVTANGYLTSTYGKIAGWTISTDSISNTHDVESDTYTIYMSTNVYTSTNKIPYNPVFCVKKNDTYPFYVRSNGVLHAEGAEISGTITATSGFIGSTAANRIILADGIIRYNKASLIDANTGFFISKDGIALGASSVFKVTSAGELTATSGSIAGWSFDSTQFTSDSGKVGVSTGSYAFWAGSTTASSAPFRVTKGGALTSTSLTVGSEDNLLTYTSSGGLTVKGNVTANTGYIGGTSGWIIQSQQIYHGTAEAVSDGSITLSTKNISKTINETALTNLRLIIGSNFGVTSAGTLYAKNAVLSGTINATSGKIGDFSINNGVLIGTYTNEDNNETRYTVLKASGVYGLAIGSPATNSFTDAPFKVSNTGKLYADSANLNSAKITGETTINTSGSVSITSPDFKVSTRNDRAWINCGVDTSQGYNDYEIYLGVMNTWTNVFTREIAEINLNSNFVSLSLGNGIVDWGSVYFERAYNSSTNKYLDRADTFLYGYHVYVEADNALYLRSYKASDDDDYSTQITLGQCVSITGKIRYRSSPSDTTWTYIN